MSATPPGGVPLSPLLEARVAGADLVVSKFLPHPPAQVWDVLVAPHQVAHWAPFIPSRALDHTGPVTLIMPGDGQDPDTPLPATVTLVAPARELAYTWGEDALMWRLDPRPEGVHLELTHTMADPAVAAGLAAGWHLCLGVAAGVLAGTHAGPIRGATAFAYGWLNLNEAYAAALGLAPMQVPHQ